jgi:ubiquinone/menaquinone biosynthesis C-methylase UbiE
MDLFDIEKFDEMTRAIYAPAYSIIAQKIVDKTGINSGKCLDIGTGCGYLGISLAKFTNLEFYLFDVNNKSLELTDQNISNNGLIKRMYTMLGDVHQIPLRANSVNLVVSRASISFWEDRAKALAEIYRILAPHGFAYIGGGYGNEELKNEVMRKKELIDFNWDQFGKLKVGQHSKETYEKALKKAHIPSYEILTEAGLWAVFHK